MYENFYGSSSHRTKRAQNVASWFSIEPVDCISFGDDNECLKKHRVDLMNANSDGLLNCKGNQFAGDRQTPDPKTIQIAVSCRSNQRALIVVSD